MTNTVLVCALVAHLLMSALPCACMCSRRFFPKCCEKVKTSFLYLSFNKPLDFMCLVHKRKYLPLFRLLRVFVCKCVFVFFKYFPFFFFMRKVGFSASIYVLHRGMHRAHKATQSNVQTMQITQMHVMTSSIQTNRYTINASIYKIKSMCIVAATILLLLCWLRLFL